MASLGNMDSIVNNMLIPWFKQRAQQLSLPNMRSPSMVPGQSAGSLGASKYAPAPGFNGARGQPFPPFGQTIHPNGSYSGTPNFGMPANRGGLPAPAGATDLAQPAWAKPPGTPGSSWPVPQQAPKPPAPMGTAGAPPTPPPGGSLAGPGGAGGLLAAMAALGLAPSFMGGSSSPQGGGAAPPTIGNGGLFGPPAPGQQFGPQGPSVPMPRPAPILTGGAALGLPQDQFNQAQAGMNPQPNSSGGTQGPGLIDAILANLKKNAMMGSPDTQGGNSGNGVYQGSNGFGGLGGFGPY